MWAGRPSVRPHGETVNTQEQHVQPSQLHLVPWHCTAAQRWSALIVCHVSSLQDGQGVRLLGQYTMCVPTCTNAHAQATVPTARRALVRQAAAGASTAARDRSLEASLRVPDGGGSVDSVRPRRSHLAWQRHAPCCNMRTLCSRQKTDWDRVLVAYPLLWVRRAGWWPGHRARADYVLWWHALCARPDALSVAWDARFWEIA